MLAPGRSHNECFVDWQFVLRDTKTEKITPDHASTIRSITGCQMIVIVTSDITGCQPWLLLSLCSLPGPGPRNSQPRAHLRRHEASLCQVYAWQVDTFNRNSQNNIILDLTSYPLPGEVTWQHPWALAPMLIQCNVRLLKTLITLYLRFAMKRFFYVLCCWMLEEVR